MGENRFIIAFCQARLSHSLSHMHTHTCTHSLPWTRACKPNFNSPPGSLAVGYFLILH
uniref:Uncharacterized protein n=1 Tax=Rhizophora mucronata TaxID=61149 RepID=A0A2P2Q7K1_RHIMU